MEPSMNLPPTIATLPDTSIAVGDTLWTRVEATDPEGDEIGYQLTVFLTLEELRDGYRAQAGMNGANEEFWFVPSGATGLNGGSGSLPRILQAGRIPPRSLLRFRSGSGVGIHGLFLSEAEPSPLALISRVALFQSILPNHNWSALLLTLEIDEGCRLSGPSRRVRWHSGAVTGPSASRSV